MTVRENTMNILHYRDYDKMPVVHFGFWRQTLEKWHAEGHITVEEMGVIRGNSAEAPETARKLGFDFGWMEGMSFLHTGLLPGFKQEILEETQDGYQIIREGSGAIVRVRKGVVSIPTQIGHTLADRKSWEEEYLPRLEYSEQRVNAFVVPREPEAGGYPLGLQCGSLYGSIRNLMGFEGLCYIQADDPDLFAEIIATVGSLAFKVLEGVLKRGACFDFAHFWEDICFKNGPMIRPSVFSELVGPHYRKIADLLAETGIDVVSVDCDGMIDALIPVWLENGVNTMFPIEVGTWGASIGPWREQYGKKLRGVGGMDKNIFALDRAAVDAEIERLRPLIDLGGYIPCPDHRIPPLAKWENVQYYCDRMRAVFS